MAVELQVNTTFDNSDSVSGLTEIEKGAAKAGKSVDGLAKASDKAGDSVAGIGDDAKKAGDGMGGAAKKAKSLMKELSEIRKEGANITLAERIEKVTKVFDKAPASIDKLTAEVKEFQSIALEAGRTSPIGREFLQKAAAAKDKLTDLQNETKRLADDNRNLSGAIQGIGVGVSAFAGVTAASAAFGGENEELQKSLVKVTAAMTLMNSVQQIQVAFQKESALMAFLLTARLKVQSIATGALASAKSVLTAVTNTSSKALKAFKVALISTGIGAIVVLIALLIANWDSLTSSIGDSTAAQKANVEATEQAVDAVGDELSAMDKLQNKLGDTTLTREEQVDAVKALQEEYPDLLSNVDAEKDGLDAVNEALELNSSLLLERAKLEAIASLRAEQFKEKINAQVEAQTEQNIGWTAWAAGMSIGIDAQEVANAQTAVSIKANNDQIDVLDELSGEIEDNIKAYEDQGAAIGDVGQRAIVLSNVLKGASQALEATNKRSDEAAKKRAAARKKAAAERKRQLDKDAADSKKAAEEQEKLQADFEAREIELEGQQAAKLKELKLANMEAGLEKDRELAQAAFENKILQLNEQGLLTLEVEKELAIKRNEELAAIDKKGTDAKEAADKVKDAKELAAAKKLKDAKIGFAQSTVDAAGALATLLIKDAKKSEAAQKAIAVTQLLIDQAKAIGSVIAGAASAAAAGGPAAPFLIAGYVASGLATVATAITSAKQILGASGGGSVGGGSASPATAPAQPDAAQPVIPTTGTGGSNVVTSEEQAGTNQQPGQQIAVKAVVSANELTQIQSQEELAEEQGTL